MKLLPLLPLQLCLLQPPRHLDVATAAEVHEQGLAATSGQLLTRLPRLRQPPVFRWILLLIALSTSFPHCLLLLGDAGLCQWGGPRCRPSPPLTWMVVPLLLLRHHHPFATTTVRSQDNIVTTVKSVLYCAMITLVVTVSPLPLIPLRLNVQYVIAQEK